MRRPELMEELRAQVASVAREAIAQTGEALVAGEISAQQVPIVAGIFVDKVHRLSQQVGPRDAGGLVESALRQLQASGGSVKLEIEVAAPAIDVTPIRDDSQR